MHDRSRGYCVLQQVNKPLFLLSLPSLQAVHLHSEHNHRMFKLQLHSQETHCTLGVYCEVRPQLKLILHTDKTCTSDMHQKRKKTTTAESQPSTQVLSTIWHFSLTELLLIGSFSSSGLSDVPGPGRNEAHSNKHSAPGSYSRITALNLLEKYSVASDQIWLPSWILIFNILYVIYYNIFPHLLLFTHEQIFFF